jgi:hypothetical protein
VPRSRHNPTVTPNSPAGNFPSTPPSMPPQPVKHSDWVSARKHLHHSRFHPARVQCCGNAAWANRRCPAQLPWLRWGFLTVCIQPAHPGRLWLDSRCPAVSDHMVTTTPCMLDNSKGRRLGGRHTAAKVVPPLWAATLPPKGEPEPLPQPLPPQLPSTPWH